MIQAKSTLGSFIRKNKKQQVTQREMMKKAIERFSPFLTLISPDALKQHHINV